MAETQNMYPINAYKIWYADAPEDLYVGSTQERLCKRMGAHRSASRRGVGSRIYQVMRAKGDTNFQYCLLGSCMVRNKDEQRKREQTYIDRLKPCLNSNRAFCTIEQRKAYLKEYHKKPCNKKRMRAYQKEYYKVKTECELCKVPLTRGAMVKHRRSKKHKRAYAAEFKRIFGMNMDISMVPDY